jgi:hypothetical protein
VHILFLAGRRNQFSVILGWVWSYFTFDVGVRLITGDGPSHRFVRQGEQSRRVMSRAS